MTIKQLVWYSNGTSAIVRFKIKRLQAHFGDSLCQVLIWREENLLPIFMSTRKISLDHYARLTNGPCCMQKAHGHVFMKLPQIYLVVKLYFHLNYVYYNFMQNRRTVTSKISRFGGGKKISVLSYAPPQALLAARTQLFENLHVFCFYN